MAKAKPLTPRQLLFVNAYLETGNLARSAQAAGYGGKTDKALNVQGKRLLDNAGVKEALKERQGVLVEKSNTKAEHLGTLWEGIMNDKSQATRDRLKASELLGKQLGVFINKTENNDTVRVIVVRGDDAKGALRKGVEE